MWKVIPFGRKGFIAGAAVAAGTVLWRARARRREEEDRRFEEEISRVVEESAGGGDQPAS